MTLTSLIKISLLVLVEKLGLLTKRIHRYALLLFSCHLYILLIQERVSQTSKRTEDQPSKN